MQKKENNLYEVRTNEGVMYGVVARDLAEALETFSCIYADEVVTSIKVSELDRQMADLLYYDE